LVDRSGFYRRRGGAPDLRVFTDGLTANAAILSTATQLSRTLPDGTRNAQTVTAVIEFCDERRAVLPCDSFTAFITQVIGEFNPGPDQLLNQAIVTAEFTRFA